MSLSFKQCFNSTPHVSIGHTLFSFISTYFLIFLFNFCLTHWIFEFAYSSCICTFLRFFPINDPILLLSKNKFVLFVLINLLWFVMQPTTSWKIFYWKLRVYMLHCCKSVPEMNVLCLVVALLGSSISLWSCFIYWGK